MKGITRTVGVVFGLSILFTIVVVNIKHLMTGPEGNSEFCFPRISMFPETKSRETLRFDSCFKFSIRMKTHFEKNPVLPIEKFPSLALPRNTIILQHLIIQFLLYYLSSGRSPDVESKRKFWTFSSKSDRGRLVEVVAYKRFQI